MFTCETCARRLWREQWEDDPINLRAWTLYHRVMTRFGVDTDTIGIAFERAARELTDEEFLDAWQRVALIYDTLHPPPKD